MRRRLSILIYHRVLPEADPFGRGGPEADQFTQTMRMLGRFFRVLPLSEAIEALRNGKLPRRAACITFDDGYADNAEVALPILRQLGLPATFFVATSFLDGGRMWNDTVIEAVRRWPDPVLEPPGLDLPPLPLNSLEERRAAVGRLLQSLKYLPHAERERWTAEFAERLGQPLPALMMSRGQVRELADAGMEIGGHTRTHPILTSLSDAAARAEIADGRDELQALIGGPVRLFAYPNGKPGTDYTATHARMVRELGFTGAVTTAWGAARADTSPWELPRFTPWDSNPWFYLGRIAYIRTKAPPFALAKVEHA